MATTLLKPKVEAIGFVDLALIGAIKQFEEGLTSPFIGDGTLVSGGIKGIAAAIIDGKGGKLGKLLSGALAVDAGEDLSIGILSMIGISPAGAGAAAGGMGGGTAGRDVW